MAYARKKKIEYTQISLEMTPEESQVLRTLLGWFVTGPYSGPRGKTDSIFKALVDAGVEPNNKMQRRSSGMVSLDD